MEQNDKLIYAKGSYEVTDEGQLFYLQPLKNAEGVSKEPIANHAPMLRRILRKQDGFTTTEQVEFSARRNHVYEPAICVDKKTMIGNQPHVAFSPACRIYLGRGNVSHYSEFMAVQCEDANVETIYTHTGWITTETGERVFLNGNSSITKDGLSQNYSVELEPDFQRFQFYPVDTDISECFQTVTDGLEKAISSKVVVPLLAYNFMTLLNDMLRHKGKEPCFSLYLIGKTGSYKSSVSKLLLCFFGKFSYADTAPITFLDTKNAVAHKLAIGADLPLLLDDRRPTNNATDKIQYEGIEKLVSSSIGDRAARGRLNADGTAKISYSAKSNLIITAEEAFVNIGSSAIARSISVELQPDTVKFKELQKLQDVPEHFNKVMQLYIQWIIENYERISGVTDKLLSEYREVFTNAGHARLATAFSQLLFGYSMYLLFLKDYEQITEADINQKLSSAKSIFLKMCDKQSRKVDDEKPTVLFIDLIREMLETKRVTVCDLRKVKTVGADTVNKPLVGRNHIGYRDDDYYYLIPTTTYTEICKFSTEGGNTFPASKTNLWRMLLDEGKITPDIKKDGSIRVDKRKRINGKDVRYIWLLASILDDSDGGEDDDR